MRNREIHNKELEIPEKISSEREGNLYPHARYNCTLIYPNI